MSLLRLLPLAIAIWIVGSCPAGAGNEAARSLELAAKSGNLDQVRVLARERKAELLARVRVGEKLNPAFFAILNSAPPETLKAVLSVPGYASATNSWGMNALQHAIVLRAKSSYAAIANFVDLDHLDAAGYAAIHHAALWDDGAAMELLVAKGAGPDSRSRNGVTALMIAAAKGRGKLVGRLLDLGVDPNVADRNGDTAMHFSARNHPDLFDLLLARGGNPHAKANNGWTPAMELEHWRR